MKRMIFLSLDFFLDFPVKVYYFLDFLIIFLDFYVICLCFWVTFFKFLTIVHRYIDVMELCVGANNKINQIQRTANQKNNDIDIENNNIPDGDAEPHHLLKSD